MVRIFIHNTHRPIELLMDAKPSKCGTQKSNSTRDLLKMPVIQVVHWFEGKCSNFSFVITFQ